jgi:hypothetical protein
MMAAKSKPPATPPLRLAPATPEKPAHRRARHVRRKLTLTLPPSVYAALLQYADREDATTTLVIETAIVHYLRRKGAPVESILLDE